MKHLRKFFESVEITESEILENFIYISDKFGPADISSSPYGELKKWTLSWNIKLNFSVLQEAEMLISKLKDLTEDIDDVLSASDRLADFNINMSLTNYLKLELIPKESGLDNYKFIKSYEWRTLFVRINEVERFFNSRGLRVVKYDLETSYNEYSQSNDLEIFLDKRDDQVNSEFHELIMTELNLIDDREYRVGTQGKSILIYPNEEKSFVEVTQK